MLDEVVEVELVEVDSVSSVSSSESSESLLDELLPLDETTVVLPLLELPEVVELVLPLTTTVDPDVLPLPELPEVVELVRPLTTTVDPEVVVPLPPDATTTVLVDPLDPVEVLD